MGRVKGYELFFIFIFFSEEETLKEDKYNKVYSLVIKYMEIKTLRRPNFTCVLNLFNIYLNEYSLNTRHCTKNSRGFKVGKYKAG